MTGVSTLFTVIILAILSLDVKAVEFERESYYSDRICIEYGGEPTGTKQGLLVDCLTPVMAMEFDWAKRPKNYECIGQAIVYSVQTGKLATCVLLAKNKKEFEFGNAQLEYMNKAGVYLIVIKLY
jgi:hypothetical protein